MGRQTKDRVDHIAPTAENSTARLFFALWPDEASRAALGRIAQALNPQCGGRAVPNRNIHLTLVFLGDVATNRIADVRAVADGVNAPGFELAIDSVSYWSHNRIVWAGPQECPAALRELATTLETALKAVGVGFDKRPYEPHITLLRAARAAPPVLTIGSVRWRIDDFALVQSLRRANATVYEVVQRWTLG